MNASEAKKRITDQLCMECVFKDGRCDICDEADDKLDMAFDLLERKEQGLICSTETIKQFKWERDTAVSQLEEIGKGLGEKMDDIKELVEKKSKGLLIELPVPLKSWIYEVEDGEIIDYMFGCECDNLMIKNIKGWGDKYFGTIEKAEAKLKEKG